MKKNLLSAILLLLSYYQCYAQEPIPVVEWAEPYSGGTNDGSITAFQGSNDLFALIKGQNTISGTASISKFNTGGMIKNQFIHSEGGSSNAPVISQYASQDGGVLVYIFLGSILRKYNDTLNLSWQKTVSYTVQNATATSANGFYLLIKRTVSDSTVSEIKRIKNDGTEEWTVALTGFADDINDIETSSDDGVMIATKNGLRKYSSTGALVWSNTTILGGYQLARSDNSALYLLTYNNLTNTRNVIQVNTANGTANWTKSLVGESITDFERTSDDGCVFSTNAGLYRYNSAGVLQWKNTGYTSCKIAITGNDKIFVIQNNSIFKLTFANELVWQKNFNNNYYVIQDIVDASDYGLYVTAAKNGSSVNNAPDFVLFKLAPPTSPCKTSFEITGQNTISCKVGNIAMTSNFGKVSMEYMSYLTDFSFQWYKNNLPIASANSYSYTATQSGKYHLVVTQQGCPSTSRTVELSIVNETQPVIESEGTQLCLGNSVSLHAKGCDGGTVVWSTGARGPNVLVNPLVTTSYTAVCEKMMNSEPCQSFASNSITITVLGSSNLRIAEVTGKKEFCENDSTKLEPVITGGIPPFSYIWARNSTNLSNEPTLPVNQEGNYVLHVFDSIGCYFRTDSIPVKKRANPVVPIISQPANTIICYGESLLLTTTAKENSYQWFLNNHEITGAINQSYAATSAGSYQLKVTNAYNCSTTSAIQLVVSASNLRITEISGKKEFCEQSATELEPVVTGGHAPFTYSWVKNSTNIANTSKLSVNQEGKYVLHVFDNIGCSSKSDSVAVKKNALPAIPSINQPVRSVICNGESVILTTNAQVTGYQWFLNNNEINGAVNASYTTSTPGTYQLKVTNASNCSSMSETPVVINLSSLKVTGISGKNELCEGTSTQLNGLISGGTTPLVFQWTKNSAKISNEATILISDEGKYVLSVSDNIGCTVKSDTLAVKKVSNPAAPIIESTSGTQICVGGSTIITTSSKESAYQWLMNNTEISAATEQSYTVTSAGDYRLKITNANGCSTSSTNSITISEIVIPQPTIKQSNDSLISSAASGNKWYFNSNEISSTSQKIKFTELGSYQVKVFDKGCESLISAVFQPSLLANEEEKFYLQLYPNPTADKVYLKSVKLFTYKLVDVTGRLVGYTAVKQNAHTIDFSRFNSGNYFIVLEEENGNIMVKKVNVSR